MREQNIEVSPEGGEKSIELSAAPLEKTLGVKNEGVSNMDYERAINKPSINGVTLIKDKTGGELNLQDKMNEITPQEIDNILYA